jgi:hypothetical protein
MSDHPSMLPPHWTAIAERPRASAARTIMLEWYPLPGAPFDISEAQRLADKGAIIMANRHFPDRVELLVRPARGGDSALFGAGTGRPPLSAAG